MTANELTFETGDMRYAAKAWGDPNNPPILALHGWLDNAASFDVLAPKLTDAYVVAPDLAGHGHTSHRPHSGSYNIWDDLHDLLSIADACGWQQFTLLGHSRGAMIAMLLAVAAPKRIANVILLDGFLPPPIPVERTAQQLQQHLRDFRKYAKRSNPASYQSIDAAVEARLAYMSIQEEAARKIVARNLQKVDGTYRWRCDERLKASSAIKLSAEHNANILANLQAPTLLLLAEEGLSAHTKLEAMLPTDSNIKKLTLPGTHHFHMQSEPATRIAKQVLSFLGACRT